MTIYKANDKYSATLTSSYTAGDPTLSVSAVPDNVPTLICAGKGTAKEVIFIVTGKTVSTLTGVSRLKGYSGNLDAQTPLKCINNQEFINQFTNAVSTPETLSQVLYGVDGGSTDDYAVALTVAPSSYTSGMLVFFKANTANTGACTLNVNSLGAKTIKKNVSSDLETNNIKAGSIVCVVYDGTNFQLLNSSDSITATSEYLNQSLFRQALMNSNFSIAERLTSSALSDLTFTYVMDRWFDVPDKNGGTLPTLTRSQQALTSGQIPGSFYFSRLNTNGAGTSLGASSLHRYHQRIRHGTRLLAGLGNKITLSFYAKSDIAGKKIGVSLSQRYGTGGVPTSAEQINGTNWTLTSSWVKYSHTFTLNTLVGKTFGSNNDDFLQLEIAYMWGSSNASVVGAGSAETYVGSGNIDIAQVQMCIGEIALPYMPIDDGVEKLACKRYFEKGRYQTSTLGGACTIGDYVDCDVQYAVEKVQNGTVTVFDSASATNKVSLRNNNTALTNGITPTVTLVSTRGFEIYAQATATTQRGLFFTWENNAEI